jgi:hypothetical protein
VLQDHVHSVHKISQGDGLHLGTRPLRAGHHGEAPNEPGEELIGRAFGADDHSSAKGGHRDPGLSERSLDLEATPEVIREVIILR